MLWACICRAAPTRSWPCLASSMQALLVCLWIHQSLLFASGLFLKIASLESSDRVGYVSTLWQQSWLTEVFPPLAAGASVVILPNPSSLPPRKFASLLKDNRITLLMTYATALERLAKEFPWAINTIRMVICNDVAEDCRRLTGTLKPHILEREIGRAS